MHDGKALSVLLAHQVMLGNKGFWPSARYFRLFSLLVPASTTVHVHNIEKNEGNWISFLCLIVARSSLQYICRQEARAVLFAPLSVLYKGIGHIKVINMHMHDGSRFS
jgi:hypothetical protein